MGIKITSGSGIWDFDPSFRVLLKPFGVRTAIFFLLLGQAWLTERKRATSKIDLPKQCNTLENSQQFLSNKYDTVVQSLQNVKKQVTKLDKT